jgi:Protein of unknown function (DUF3522)
MPVVRWFWLVSEISRKYFGEALNWKAFYWFFVESNNFRLTWLLFALVTLILGVTIRFSIDTNNYYWLVHSAWHFSIMMAPLCSLLSYPKYDEDFSVEIEDNFKPLKLV